MHTLRNNTARNILSCFRFNKLYAQSVGAIFGDILKRNVSCMMILVKFCTAKIPAKIFLRFISLRKAASHCFLSSEDELTEN